MVVGILKRMPKGAVSSRLLEAFSQGSNSRGVRVGGTWEVQIKSEKNRCLPGFPQGTGKGADIRGEARSRAFDSGGQAPKGAWGMTRHQEALKGAEDCDKPGVTVKQVMIPGCPNRLQLNP